ncbi:MAG: hypothetical protein GQ574_15125 [Crocinitomix sp.]|nr:hypothetical protein [Crocinitomix sp.]
MTDINEVLESEEEGQSQVHKSIRSLAIVAFILHGFCLFGVLLGSMVLVISAYDNSQGNRSSNLALGLTIAMMLIVAILAVLAIIGANKLRKGKKSGFPLLAIGSGLMGALVLFGAYLSWSVNPQTAPVVIGVLLIGLVAAFAKNLKHL